jgi:transcription elongation GreA/GreB family factor
MAQALIGKTVGDKVTVPTETATQDVEILSITLAKKPA